MEGLNPIAKLAVMAGSQENSSTASGDPNKIVDLKYKLLVVEDEDVYSGIVGLKRITIGDVVVVQTCTVSGVKLDNVTVQLTENSNDHKGFFLVNPWFKEEYKEAIERSGIDYRTVFYSKEDVYTLIRYGYGCTMSPVTIKVNGKDEKFYRIRYFLDESVNQDLRRFSCNMNHNFCGVSDFEFRISLVSK